MDLFDIRLMVKTYIRPVKKKNRTKSSQILAPMVFFNAFWVQISLCKNQGDVLKTGEAQSDWS